MFSICHYIFLGDFLSAAILGKTKQFRFNNQQIAVLDKLSGTQTENLLQLTARRQQTYPFWHVFVSKCWWNLQKKNRRLGTDADTFLFSNKTLLGINLKIGMFEPFNLSHVNWYLSAKGFAKNWSKRRLQCRQDLRRSCFQLLHKRSKSVRSTPWLVCPLTCALRCLPPFHRR